MERVERRGNGRQNNGRKENVDQNEKRNRKSEEKEKGIKRWKGVKGQDGNAEREQEGNSRTEWSRTKTMRHGSVLNTTFQLMTLLWSAFFLSMQEQNQQESQSISFNDRAWEKVYTYIELFYLLSATSHTDLTHQGH